MSNSMNSTLARKWPRLGFSLCPDLQTRQPRRTACLDLEKPPKRPDPGIYSQFDRLNRGLPASWDSPDITTNLAGDVDEFVDVKVRNYSADSPAIGVNVALSFSDLGIGLERQNLGSQSVDLARAGAPGAERLISFFVPSSIRQDRRRIAVFVNVSHPHDRDQQNNVGEQAWSASTGTVGETKTFDFPVRNRLAIATTFELQVINSELPGALSLSSLTLNPGQSAPVTFSVPIPAGVVGEHRFNIAAFDSGGELYGGIFHRIDVVGA